MAVLVGYATEHGSTRGIAERIAERLAEHGIQVDVALMSQVSDLASYDELVLGSAIHNADWLAEGVEFMAKNRESLTGRPIWLFSVCSVGEKSSAFNGLVSRYLRKAVKAPAGIAAVLPELHVLDHHRFAGVIRAEHWGKMGTLFLRLTGGHYGDLRNWPEVDTWAARIASDIGESAVRRSA